MHKIFSPQGLAGDPKFLSENPNVFKGKLKKDSDL